MGIILQSILALLFVLGLLLLTLWVIKYVQTKAPGCKAFRNLQEGRRLRIIENQKIDAGNSLLLVKKDDKEFLLFCGNRRAVLLDMEKTTVEAKKND